MHRSLIGPAFRAVTVILLLTFGLAGGAHAEEAADACDARLTDGLDLPGGWGFAPGEFLEMAHSAPALHSQLKAYARLARFLSEDNTEFFELLGSYFNLGHVRDLIEEIAQEDSDEIKHRYLQLHFMGVHAADLGLFPVDFNEDEMEFMALSLGPLPFGRDMPLGQNPRVSPEWVAKVNRFVRANPVALRDLVMHSSAARLALINTEPSRVICQPGPALDAFDARLRGAPGPESADEKYMLDRLDEVLDGKTAEIRAGRTKGERQRLRAERDLTLITACLSETIVKAAQTVDTARRSAPGNDQTARHPFHMMTAFMIILQMDQGIDRGLTNYMRKAFAELVLDRPVASGPEVMHRIRHALRTELDVLRRAWRAQFKMERALREQFARNLAAPVALVPAADATVVRDREERLRTYVRAAEPAALVEAPAPARPVVARVSLDPAKAFWDALAAPEPSLEAARARFRRDVRADEVYELPLKRQGFRYRVEFSAALLARMLDPRAGEVQDLRTWISALREGRARPNGQAGWKKLTTAHAGLYRWEIKVKHSPYRMLGYQRNDGVWRFGLIEHMH